MDTLRNITGFAAMAALGLAAFASTASTATDARAADAVMMPKQIVITSNRVGGASNVMANAISTVLTKYVGTGATVRPVGAAGTWTTMFENKEIDFGVTSVTELNWAYWGLQAYKGKAKPVFQIVALGSSQPWTFMVAKDTGVKTTQDFVTWMKGKRITHKWVNPVIDVYDLAGLANLGFNSLEEARLEAVPVTSYRDLARIWSERRADILGQPPGVPTAEEQNIARPIRYISLNDGPEALARMKAVEPAVYLSKVKPGATGVEDEITALTYDYCMVARSTLDPAVVNKVLATLHEHQAEFYATHPLVRDWGPAEERWVGDRTPMPYHPGAIAYYKSKGLWGPEMDKRQAELAAATPK